MKKGWTVAFALLACFWTYQGHEQSRAWRSNPSLWEREAGLQPYNLWVQQNYATALLEARLVHEACFQLGYIQKLVRTERMVNEAGVTPKQLDAWLSDRILVLAYFDHQNLGVTECRDDNIFSAASR